MMHCGAVFLPVWILLVVGSLPRGVAASEVINATAQAEKPAGFSWDVGPGTPVVPETLETLAGRIGWARLADRSQMAPVRVVVTPVESAEGRVGHQVQIAFTLQASLASFQEKARGEQALGVHADTAGNSVRLLTEDEKEQADPGPQDPGPQDPGATLGFLSMTLLNRVDLQGVVQAVRYDAADGVRLTWAFDHRFGNATGLQTCFRRWGSNPLGERVLGDPQPYAGAGGVIVARDVSELVEATDRPLLLVESRMVFAEPKDWFGGGNLLRAKIPLLAQEGVRNLRRRLAAEGK
ncbi:MAG: hypothetical protein EBU59_01750 [Planctomycetia bacterium]|nr:hypothetical protein [Planctomycetia bacterium]